MQNAHRAKQLKEVELDRAKVKDDGMWEVSQSVRDAWGLERNSDSSPKVIHESSYLPFIFSSTSNVAIDDSLSSRKIAGRRTFNNQGEEVSQLASSTPDELQLSGTPTTADSPKPSSKRKIHPRPISISASGTSGQLKGFEQLQKPKDSKTARQTIFDSGGVGTDLRTPSRKNDVTSASTSFMKPAGVDDPKNNRTLSTSESIIEGVRQKQIKRERDHNGDEPHDSKKKLKKRKSG